jgi:Type IV secretion-system coupling protein DNA-binding domain
LGSLIVTGIEQAALSRKEEESRSRRPFYLYIDEFADFVASEGSVMTFAHILSEARKFGLSLTLAHQTLSQMSSERIKGALGNIGTKIVFAVDRDDAEIMAKKLFMISGEDIKHEVEDERQQEKSHPMFYSLAEEWEGVTQEIQNLKPRSALVKAPQRAVAKIKTIPVPKHTLAPAKLEAIKRRFIMSQALVVGAGVGERREPTSRKEEMTYLDFSDQRVTEHTHYHTSQRNLRARVTDAVLQAT